MRQLIVARCCAVLIAVGHTTSHSGPQSSDQTVLAQEAAVVRPATNGETKPAGTRRDAAREVPPHIIKPGYIDEPMPTPALQKMTEFEFIDTPLKDALIYFAEAHDLTIWLDETALKDAGVRVDSPLNIVGSRIPLHHALGWILKPLKLTWVYDDGVLTITTQAAADEQMVTQIYDTRLVNNARKRHDTPRKWKSFLQQTLDVDWQSIDGTGGTIEAVGHRLVICQTAAAHRDIQRLLQAVQQVQQEWITILAPPSQQKIVEALRKEVDIEHYDPRLQDICDYFADSHSIEIRLDEESLDAAGFKPDATSTIELSGVSLRKALSLILQPRELTWMIRDSALIVTTPEVAEEELQTVVYRVSDLGVTSKEARQLRMAILRTPGLWLSVDGTGGRMTALGPDVLVVRNTWQVHDEIQKLLQSFRRMEAVNDIPTPPPAEPEWQTKKYVFDTDTARDLLRTIPQLVAPESWETADQPAVKQQRGQIFLVAADHNHFVPSPRSPVRPFGHPDAAIKKKLKMPMSILLIRQTSDVHQQIRRFLMKNHFHLRPVKGVVF